MNTKYIISLLLLIIFKFNYSFTQSIIEENSKNSEKIFEIGEALQEAIYNKDVSGFMNYIDINTLVKNIIKDDKSKISKNQKEFLQGLINSMDGIAKKLISEVENGAYYDFIDYNYDPIKQTYFILFRLYSYEGLNYHNYRVYIVDDELLIGDIYYYTAGEYVSQTLRRLYLNAIPKNKISALLGDSNTEDFMKLISGFLLTKEGKYREAYDILDSIKGSTSKEKYYLIIKLHIASALDDDLYAKTIEKIEKIYGDDPSMSLSLIDYYTLKEDYDKVHELLDQLMFETNDDFLNYMKGSIEIEREDYKKAISYLKPIADDYPDFFEGLGLYIYALSEIKEYKTIFIYLEKTIERGYLKEDIIEYIEEPDELGQNIFKSFSNSKEYIDWKG